MTLTNTYKGKDGKEYLFEYSETDSFEELEKDRLQQVIAFAFHKDKMILVNNTAAPGQYIPLGGGVESGEKGEDTLIRGVKEESNMKVLDYKPLGYQKVTDMSGELKPYYQLRYFCVVEPYGPFVSDPDGDITEVIEIDPIDYKKYFDWGEIGDAIMNKVFKIKNELK